MTDTITLTKGEVKGAVEEKKALAEKGIALFDCFLEYRADYCGPINQQPCALCKKLSQFAKEEK